MYQNFYCNKAIKWNIGLWTLLNSSPIYIFFLYSGMSRIKTEGLVRIPIWQNFYFGTRRFLPCLVGSGGTGQLSAQIPPMVGMWTSDQAYYNRRCSLLSHSIPPHTLIWDNRQLCYNYIIIIIYYHLWYSL